MKKKPENLKECIEELKNNTSVEDLEIFEKSQEQDTCLYHHGCGTNLRNNWELWTKDSPLAKYFNSIGIYHADDMSAIIFTSFHQLLNKKPINLKEQVEHYQDYWKEMGFKDGNPLNDSKENYSL